MFAVEEYEGPSYKSVHAAGCRDLRDPEPVPGSPRTLSELLSAVDGYAVADDLAELVRALKPCAVTLLASLADGPTNEEYQAALRGWK